MVRRWRLLLTIVASAVGALLLALVASNSIRAADDWIMLGKGRLSQLNVKRVFADGPLIYIGTAFKLNIYDTRSDKNTVVEGLPDTYITAIAADADSIWVGTMSGGIARVDKQTLKVLKTYSKESTGGKLTDNWITDILLDGSLLWIATKRWGVVQFDIETGTFMKRYSVLEGLGDNAVNALALDGQSIWAATDGGVSVYDKSFDMWMSYTAQDGLPSDLTTSLAVDGEFIWIGTASGVARYNKLEGQFTVYGSAEGLADDSIQCLTVDGSYIWVGTFAGANRFDKGKTQWTTVTGLPEESVSYMAVNGNYIWFGTEGGGAARFDKKIPEARISPLTHYLTNSSQVEVVGTSYSYKDIASFSLEFRSEIANQYLKTGIAMERTPKILDSRLGIWNVEGLPNIPHYLRLTVQDKDGQINTAEVAFMVDTLDPSLQVDALAAAVSTPDITLTGRYSELNLVRITVQRGREPPALAEIDRRNKTFSWYANLVPGVNNLVVSAEDIAGRRVAVNQSIIYDPDTDRPEIMVTGRTNSPSANFVILGKCRDFSLKTVTIQPGNINAPFEAVENEPNTWAFATAPIELNEGENKFTVEAYDQLGRKTQIPISVSYVGGVPSITVEKPTSRTNRPNITVRGTWSDNNIREITVDPGGVKAAINNQSRTFTAPVALKEGQNVVTATIYDKDGQFALATWEVLYSSADARLVLDLSGGYSSSRKFALSGTFRDPNMKKIMLQPGDIPVATTSNSFEMVLNLTKEINDFRVELIDKTGKVSASRPFRIILDETAPELGPPDVPSVVGLSPVTLKGTYNEKYLRAVVADPSGAEAEIDTNTKTYTVRVPAQPGANAVALKAFDMAGNETTSEVKFVYREGAQVAVGEGMNISDTNILKQIRYLNEEITRLKNRPAAVVAAGPAGPAGPVRPVRPAMPAGLAVFFVPFDPADSDSLYGLTQDYLGSRSWWPLVSAMNDVPDYSLIARRKKLLFPSKDMVRYLSRTGLYADQSRLMNAAAIAFNSAGAGRSTAEYRQRLEEFLIRERMLSDRTSGEIVVNGVMIVFGSGSAFDKKRGEALLKANPSAHFLVYGRVAGSTLHFYTL